MYFTFLTTKLKTYYAAQGQSIKDVRKGEGVVKSGRLWTWEGGLGEFRTSAIFWGFSKKFDINLDKNC